MLPHQDSSFWMNTIKRNKNGAGKRLRILFLEFSRPGYSAVWHRAFIESCGFIPAGASPRVETERMNMIPVLAGSKDRFSVISPGTGQKNRMSGNSGISCKTASGKDKSEAVVFRMRRSCDISSGANLGNGTHLAIGKRSISTSENEIYRAFDQSVFKKG